MSEELRKQRGAAESFEIARGIFKELAAAQSERDMLSTALALNASSILSQAFCLIGEPDKALIVTSTTLMSIQSRILMAMTEHKFPESRNEAMSKIEEFVKVKVEFLAGPGYFDHLLKTAKAKEGKG